MQMVLRKVCDVGQGHRKGCFPFFCVAPCFILWQPGRQKHIQCRAQRNLKASEMTRQLPFVAMQTGDWDLSYLFPILMEAVPDFVANSFWTSC